VDWTQILSSSIFTPIILVYLFFLIGGVQLGPLGSAATNRPLVPATSDYDDEEIGGVIGRGN
jgi:hypothetical protein